MAGQGSILRPSQDADLGNPGAISPDCRGTARTDALATVPDDRRMVRYRGRSTMGHQESCEALSIRHYETTSGKRRHYGNIVPTFYRLGTMCDSVPSVKRTNMNTTQDLQAVLAAVSRATNIPESRIFSRCKGQDHLDARWMAVQLLVDLGYYDRQIADVTGMTQRAINKIRNAAANRANGTWRQFRTNLEAARNLLGITPTA